jgi:hypothetical protein
VTNIEECSSEPTPSGHKQTSLPEASTSISSNSLQAQAKVASSTSNPHTRPRKTSQGILHAIPQRPPMAQNMKPQGSIDKPISLKKELL